MKRNKRKVNKRVLTFKSWDNLANNQIYGQQNKVKLWLTFSHLLVNWISNQKQSFKSIETFLLFNIYSKSASFIQIIKFCAKTQNSFVFRFLLNQNFSKLSIMMSFNDISIRL
jgi:hypothetical protein